MVYDITTLMVERHRLFWHTLDGKVLNLKPSDVDFRPGRYCIMTKPYGERSGYLLRVVCMESGAQYDIDDEDSYDELLRLIAENPQPRGCWNCFKNRKY